MTSILLVGLAVLLPGPSPTDGQAAARPHPLHLSTTLLAVDESAAFLRVRMFKTDLEAALVASTGRDSLDLAPIAVHDSLFLSYFVERFELRFDGAPSARPLLVGSGEDLTTDEGDERIWWVELRYDLAAPATRVAVRARQLYELFDDQRNIVRVLDTATERQRTLYFAAPDDGWSEVDLT